MLKFGLTVNQVDELEEQALEASDLCKVSGEADELIFKLDQIAYAMPYILKCTIEIDELKCVIGLQSASPIPRGGKGPKILN